MPTFEDIISTDNLVEGRIKINNNFAKLAQAPIEGITIKNVALLPALPDPDFPVDQIVYLTTDGKLYKNVADVWVAIVNAVDLEGQITADKIADGSIGGTKFASGISAPKVVSSLPTLPDGSYPPQSLVVLTTDGKLYRNVADSWQAGVAAVDITGQIVEGQIADLSITKSKFATEINVPEIVTSLPTLPDATYPEFSLVVLTTDGKLYRNVGGSWTAAVQAVDVVGQITQAQLEDGAITASKLAGSLTVPAIVSSLPVLPNVNFPPNTLVVLETDGKVYRNTSGTWTAEVPATDLTGQITETQISDGAISTPKILAGAITAGTIATGAITAGKIAADAVTAGTIAAGSVSTDELAADAVTAAKISAGSITTAKLAAGAVTANEIAANTITSGQIAANTITASQIAANTITASQIAGNTITAGQIAAGAITASELDAGSVTTAKLGVGIYNLAAGKSVSGTATGTLPTDGNKAVGSSYLSFGTGSQGSGAESAYVQVDLGGNVRVEEVKAYFYAQDSRSYWYKVKYSTDGTNWSYFTSGTGWHTSPNSSTAAAGDYFPTVIQRGAVTARYIRLYADGNTVNTGNHIYELELFESGTVIAGSHIRTGSITAKNIAANTITATQIAANTITASQIAANTITASQIAADTITAGQIAAGAISTTELAASAVTAAKIAANTITASQIASNTITATQIAATTITSNELAANSVIAGKIAAGSITTDKLTTSEINLTNSSRSGYISVRDGGNALKARFGNISGLSGVPTGTQYGMWGELGTGVYIKGAPKLISAGGQEFSWLWPNMSNGSAYVVLDTSATLSLASNTVPAGKLWVPQVSIAMEQPYEPINMQLLRKVVSVTGQGGPSPQQGFHGTSYQIAWPAGTYTSFTVNAFLWITAKEAYTAPQFPNFYPTWVVHYTIVEIDA